VTCGTDAVDRQLLDRRKDRGCKRQRVRVRRELAVRDRDDRRTGGRRGAQPVRGVLDRDAVGRRNPEATSGLEVDIGRRFAAPHLFRGHRHGEAVLQGGLLEDEVDDRPVRRGRQPKRPARREPLHRVDGAGDQRQGLAVAPLDVVDHGRVDLLGAHRHAELVAHVARPLRRAHAEHRPGRSWLPRAAHLGDQIAARLVPRGLGVHQDAVEVEDDRSGHGMIIACRSS
jgi:hypothetical protein